MEAAKILTETFSVKRLNSVTLGLGVNEKVRDCTTFNFRPVLYNVYNV